MTNVIINLTILLNSTIKIAIVPKLNTKISSFHKDIYASVRYQLSSLVKQTKMWFWYSTATGGKSRIAVVDVLPPLPPNLIYMFARYFHARVLSRHIFTIISSRAFPRVETTAIFKGDKTLRSYLSLLSWPDCSIFLVFPHFSSETRNGSFLQSFWRLIESKNGEPPFLSRDARLFILSLIFPRPRRVDGRVAQQPRKS